MMKQKLIGTAAGLILLTGCSMFGGGEQADEGAAASTSQGPDVVDVGTYEGAGSRSGEGLGGDDARARAYGSEMTEAELRAKNVVYFDFDESRVRPEARTILTAHAGYLAANLGQKVLLAGHADERGTREYNMALGEKRSIAVRNFLLANGVRSSQMETVSYGEEKPADFGSGELSWSRNRRVELIYE